MNDGGDIAVDTPVRPTVPRRARALAVLSIALGGCSFAVLPTPLPSAFPWLTLLLSLSGTTLAVIALRERRRGGLATVLAWLGLAVSLAFPFLVVFVFVRYLNVNS